MRRPRISRRARRFLAFTFGIDARANPIEAMEANKRLELGVFVFVIFTSIVIMFMGVLAMEHPAMYGGLFVFTSTCLAFAGKIAYLDMVDSVAKARELNAQKERNINYLREIQSIEGLYGIAYEALAAIAETEVIDDNGHCSHCGADLNGRPNRAEAEYHEMNCGYPYLQPIQEALLKASEVYSQAKSMGVR